MKLLVVFLLVGTMMVLSEGFPEPEPVPEKPTEESEPETESPDEGSPGENEHSIVKRATEATGCPCGWRQFGTRCLIVNEPMKWTDAQSRCLAMGGNLLSVHNVRQNNWALSLLGNKRAWCAGSDAQEDGRWFNVDGTPFDYANWCHGEPNNRGGPPSCAEINYKGQRCWNDQGCTTRLYSICARRVYY